MILRKIEDFITKAGEKDFNRAVFLLHLLCAMVIFAPFIFFGKVIVGSTDNFFHHFPNMIFNMRAFQGGDWGLWNPYILSGMDFSASTHNFLYFPLNWLLFILPQKFFLVALTIRIFLEVWLLGVFSYLFFREELGDRKWAVFSSVLHQLCGYTFFAITTYANLTIYLAMMIALYFVWTINIRKKWYLYVVLVSCFITMFLSGNIVYGFAATMIFTILFFYRFWTNPSKGLARYILIVLMSIITACLISTVRILPVFKEIMGEGTRVMGGLALRGIGGYIYLFCSSFLPEVFGINLGTSVPIIKHLLSGGNCHAQFHGYPYFGMLSLILILWCAFFPRSKKNNFWLVYLAISSAVFLQIQPVIDFFIILLYPLYHLIIPKMMIPLALCTVVGYSAISVEKNITKVQKWHLIVTGLFTFLGLFFAFNVWILFRQDTLVKVAKPLFNGLFVLSVIAALFYRYRDRFIFRQMLFMVILGIGILFLWFLKGFIGLSAASIIGLFKTNALFFNAIVCEVTCIAVLMVLLVVLFRRRSDFYKFDRIDKILLFLGSVGFIFVLFYPCFDMASEASDSVGLLTIFGALRAVIVTLVFIFTLFKVKTHQLKSAVIFIFFISIIFVDLLFFNKIYAFQVTNPFVKSSKMYPGKDEILNPDSRQQEVNYLNNDSFEHWDSGIIGWTVGGGNGLAAKINADKVAGDNSLKLIGDRGETTLYQDINVNGAGKDRVYAFGVWAKAFKSRQVRLLLTDEKHADFSVYHDGDGKWRWLEVTHRVGKKFKWVRPHIIVSEPGDVYVDGARLVLAQHAYPVFGQDKEHIKSKDFNEKIPVPQENLDLKNFRVNHPHMILQYANNELQTNIPFLYGIRFYGGVNSSLLKDHTRFVYNFVDTLSKGGEGAISADITDARYLDLMGCRYDTVDGQNIMIRPGAVSRFMLFKDFETITDPGKTLIQLKSDTFRPREKVFLDLKPAISSQNGPGLDIAYSQKKFSLLELTVKIDEPGILFFGDTYRPDWKAYVDGRSVRVMRANYEFMAIELPSGEHNIIWRFEPKYFYLGLFITVAGYVIFLMITVILLVWFKGSC